MPAEILPEPKRKELQRSTDKPVTEKTSVLVAIRDVINRRKDRNDVTSVEEVWRLTWSCRIQRHPWSTSTREEIPPGQTLIDPPSVHTRVNQLISGVNCDISDDLQRPRMQAFRMIAHLVLTMGLTIKGGFIRDHVVWQEDANDIDVDVPLDMPLHQVRQSFLERLNESAFNILKERSTDHVVSINVTNEKSTYSVQIQFIHVTGRMTLESDLSSNNLAINQTKGLHLFGRSGETLEETLYHCCRREFGIQSGWIVPRVKQRAALLVEQGWKRIRVPPIPTIENELNENEK